MKEKINIVNSVPDREIDVTPNWSGMFGYAMVLASQLEEGQGRQFVIDMLEYGKKLEDLRRKNEEEEMDSISIGWEIEDVHYRARSETLTDDEAREVLRLAKKNHDASIGINWEVIGIWIDYVINERGEK